MSSPLGGGELLHLGNQRELLLGALLLECRQKPAHRRRIVDGGHPVAGAPYIAPGLGFVRQRFQLALANALHQLFAAVAEFL